MMNNKIIHLKNVIIFKILIYILSITFFAFILPILQSSLDYSKNKTKIAKSELQDLESKLAFINNSQDIIKQSYQEYSEETKKPFDISCFLHSELNQKYINLAKNFNLPEDPKLFSSSKQTIDNFEKSQRIKILTTKITLSFKVQNLNSALDFILGAYMQLPKYSAITSFDINNPDFITPESINELKANITPAIIRTSTNMLIREIKVKNL